MPPKNPLAKLKKEPAAGAMSKSEIQSWISSATTSSAGNGEDQEQVWRRDQVLNDWPRSLDYAQNYLLNEKTKARTVFLHDEILSLAKHAGSVGSLVDFWALLLIRNAFQI